MPPQINIHYYEHPPHFGANVKIKTVNLLKWAEILKAKIYRAQESLGLQVILETSPKLPNSIRRAIGSQWVRPCFEYPTQKGSDDHQTFQMLGCPPIKLKPDAPINVVLIFLKVHGGRLLLDQHPIPWLGATPSGDITFL